MPLSAWPQAETVTFYALSGELDWAEISAVAAASADGTVDGESPREASRSVSGRPATAVALATGGSDAEFVEGGFHVIMTPTSECGGEQELFGLWPYGGEAWTDSFEFEFEDRYWEDPQNAFTLDIEGTLKLDYPAFVTFQIAADDSAEFHVGHLTFSANGDDGEGGVYHEGVAVSGMLTAGTHQIRGHYVNEWGVACLKVLRWEITPLLAQFQVDRTEIEVPWARGKSVTAFTTSGMDTGIDSETTYEVVAANGTTLPDWVLVERTAGMQIDNQAFLETGLDSVTLQLALRQTFRGYTVDSPPVSVRVWRKPLPDVKIQVDANNDGTFDETTSKTFLRFWKKEKDQEGYQRLLDFSPFLLKINPNFVEQLNLERDPETFEVVLRSTAIPLNVLWTGMEDAYEPFYRSIVTTCGPMLNAQSTTFPVQTIPGGGLEIPLAFLRKAQTSGGILMAEAPEAGAGFLTFAVRFAGSQVDLFERHITILSVPMEEMFARVNLRGTEVPPAIEPDLLPAEAEDATCALYFLHGFKVNESEALDWQKEMFRRLYRKNCRALFYGVTWEGNMGATGMDYHASVANAFVTGERLAAYVTAQNAASGTSAPTNNVFMAHSLGNMVVASAIQDHGLTPTKVIMLNAAIPSEALNAEAFTTINPESNGLVPKEWKDYDSKTWCSCWHQLFANTDRPQKNLTWKNRFSKLREQNVLNLYSTGDEVLEVNEEVPNIWDDDGNFAWHAWQAQELGKGKGGAYGSNVAGWKFKKGKPSPQVANGLTDEELRTNPVFNIDSRMMASSISTNDWNTLLAHGIPALSCPVGNPVQHAEVQVSRIMRDIDLNEERMKVAGWERPNGETKWGNRWLHGDIKGVDYFYTWKAFDEIVKGLPTR